ncbi:hypothetical protein C3E98_003710 [Pseudomonas sp. MWU13-2625]|nr:hypothetical protein C3E98_003710 [Pseudomonas sp. MWU13-2625]
MFFSLRAEFMALAQAQGSALISCPPQLQGLDMFLWRGSLLPLGGEAPVNPACRVYLEEWGSRL